MDGQNNDASAPSAEESAPGAPDAALEAVVSPAPEAHAVQEAVATPTALVAAPVPFDSATQSIGDTAVAAPASTPALADGATGASDASDLVGHVQAALDREGLGASVSVTQLDATGSAALRVLLQSKNRDAVLRAAGALIASSAGGHSWVFISSAPPDPVNDPEQKSGALLHAVS